MNLLLLEDHELDARRRAVVTGRRAHHLLEVLRVELEQRVRAGIVDGARGHATVVGRGDGQVEVEVDCAEPAPVATDALLLAVPRPKVLLRMLEHAAALGFSRVVLFRSWRVEKSHLRSRAMDPQLQRDHLLLGLEQAHRTAVPTVTFFDRFRPFVEDRLEELPLPCQRFCAHPAAATSTAQLALAPGAPFALALGPDGGFLPWEVEQLARRGFLPTALPAGPLGPHPLRTESALSALWAQLDLLRRRR